MEEKLRLSDNQVFGYIIKYSSLLLRQLRAIKRAATILNLKSVATGR